MICECDGWCRAEPQPATDKHHMTCEKYNETIRVVEIQHDGSGYCDADMVSALQSLIDGGDYTYQVKLVQMLKREYDKLEEFQGF